LIETPGGLETFGLNQSKEVDYLAKTRERAEKTAEEFGKKRLKEYRE
jgi:hypothetical protein